MVFFFCGVQITRKNFFFFFHIEVRVGGEGRGGQGPRIKWHVHKKIQERELFRNNIFAHNTIIISNTLVYLFFFFRIIHLSLLHKSNSNFANVRFIRGIKEAFSTRFYISQKCQSDDSKTTFMVIMFLN